MNTLIIKLGATGDVVRTTPLLRRLKGRVTWITSSRNRPLLHGLNSSSVELRVLTFEERARIGGESFELTISLEDDAETATVLESVRSAQVFGAYPDKKGGLRYTDAARPWFDMSLISVHGRKQADALKLRNRRTYQEMVFAGLGLGFCGEGYLLPATAASPLQGDVAIAPEAGGVWPMKRWAYFDRLKTELEALGLKVNVLPTRPTLLAHLADVRAHRCVVSGDSLPMHLAMGSGIKCVALFNCTSPWEIFDYGLLRKVVSPLLEEFFYRRDFDPRATTAIRFEEVREAVLTQLR